MKTPRVAVLCGGISPERDVSIVSGKHVFEALQKNFCARLFTLDENKVPEEINAEEYIVYPAMHGDYGENGDLQANLDFLGIEYAGSGELSSRVCMVKPAAKALIKSIGLPVAKEFIFSAENKPSAEILLNSLGSSIILKPADKGSSVGLSRIQNLSEAKDALGNISNGMWLAEEFFIGRELSVGVIDGKAAGIVEIKPEGGVYDFKRKYTAGQTVYEFPAKLEKHHEDMIKSAAQKAYKVCACRDFCRIDFLINTQNNTFIVIEINTLPGMTPTSLLPKSASCIGLDFEKLCAHLIAPAIQRFSEKHF